MKITTKVGDLEFVVEVSTAKELEDVLRILRKYEKEESPTVKKDPRAWPTIDWLGQDNLLGKYLDQYPITCDGRLPGQPQPFFKYP